MSTLPQPLPAETRIELGYQHNQLQLRAERAEGATVGMPTHMPAIDGMFGGLEDGRLYLIAGDSCATI